MIHRRSFLAGLFSVLAAPAIVRASSIMPVSAPAVIDPWVDFQSWPLGQTPPFPCVSGHDLLSRAQKLCSSLSVPQPIYFRAALKAWEDQQ